MIFKNVNGQSYSMIPAVIANPNLPGNTVVTAKQIDGNKILFFSGTMPSVNDCLDITAANIESKGFTKLLETQEFGITYTYNVDNKKRLIRKTVIDAMELSYLAAGTIGWAAIILNNPETSNSYVIFTDTIGTWGDTQAPIILDNKVGTLNSRNLFKNVSIEIADKSNLV